ncbi:MAG: hypothetical protein ACJAX3_000331 [Patiriisocius sp.]|jgi:hypothetical protein
MVIGKEAEVVFLIEKTDRFAGRRKTSLLDSIKV